MSNPNNVIRELFDILNQIRMAHVNSVNDDLRKTIEMKESENGVWERKVVDNKQEA